jgi:hypothetical protein
MSKNNIIKTYEVDLDRLDREKASLNVLQPEIRLRINEIKSPISQLDEAIAEFTVDVNKKIYDLSVVADDSVACGCGKTAQVSVLVDNVPTLITINVGTTYYYEHAKTLRMSGEDVNYIGTNPYEPLNGEESTNFNSGIGSDTIVVGANSDSILELVISNAGTGYASTLSPYYSQELIGGSGSGAKVDVVVGAGSSSITSISISNAGSGYAVGQSLSLANFAGASLLITDVGSPILGVGTETYILASSGIGSVFVQDVDTSKISTCATNCSSYKSQMDTLESELNTLRAKRDVLLDGVNSLKKESERFFLQSYAFSFARGQGDLRISQINKAISVLTDNKYDSYFT